MRVRFGLRAKMLLLVIIPVLFLLAVGAGAIYAVLELQGASSSIYEKNVETTGALSSAQAAFQRMAILVMAHTAAMEAGLMDELAPQIKAAEQETLASLTTYEQRLAQDDPALLLVAEVRKAITDYFTLRDDYLAKSRQFLTQFTPEVSKSLVGAFQRVQQAFQPLLDQNTLQAQATSVAANRTADNSLRLIVIMVAAGVVVALVINLLVSMGLLRSMRRLLDGMEKLRQGNMTTRISARGRDEIAQALRAYNTSVEAISHLIGQALDAARQFSTDSHQLALSAEEVGRSARQVASVVEQMAQSSDRQARLATETGQSAQSMEQAVGEVVAAVTRMTQQAQEAEQRSRAGQQAMQRISEQMGRIATTVRSSAESIQELGQHSRRIGEILDVITGIADQTNLLALNAAIEAARAGEQGRGFAVVAEEVRKLAEQSRTAAEQIAGLVRQIQGGTERAVDAMRQGSEAVNAGVTVVDESGKAFESILGAVQGLVHDIQRVEQSASQLGSASEGTLRAVEEIASMTEETASGAEEISSAAEEQSAAVAQIAGSARKLADQARSLYEAVSVFEVDHAEVSAAEVAQATLAEGALSVPAADGDGREAPARSQAAS